jgi:hypothetical protein
MGCHLTDAMMGSPSGGPKFTPVAYIIAMENTIFGDLLEFCYQTTYVIFGTIFALKRCSIRLYLQLCVEGLISYLRYLSLLAYRGVVLFCLSSSCAICTQC